MACPTCPDKIEVNFLFLGSSNTRNKKLTFILSGHAGQTMSGVTRLILQANNEKRDPS